jgi:peroxiredoxin
MSTTVETKTTTAPDFTLADVEGQSIQLSDYRGAKNIVLVFNRGFM